MAQSGGVNREHHRSNLPKFVFWLLHFLVIAVCSWIVYFNGWRTVGGWFGQEWQLSDPIRAGLLLWCAAIYFLRTGITLFYLLARRVDWSEVFGLAVFMAFFEIGLLLVGGGAFRAQPINLDLLDGLAIFLFVSGSWLNTWSEVQRKLWKQNPANKGKCYVDGLFRHSMHINYFGDVVLFAGWSLLTHNILILVLPFFMVLMFAFVHIPALDAYLAGRYGSAFDEYARKTKKLVPYVW
ncbi:MAG: DUF1295 domain-containing protein [Hyphomicrobiales bacterium]|nr:DUF1295 domain-containing protein [Hyphomicrobiales bacterium]